MWLVLLVGCREPGRFVKVVVEGSPCALTSTGRVACAGASAAEDPSALHWLNVPAATDLEEDWSTACSVGNWGVQCYFQGGSRGGHWPEHTPGRYLDVAMSQTNWCTLDEDGVVECVGWEDHLALDGGPYVQIGVGSEVCGRDTAGRVECTGRPELSGTYDWMTVGYSTRVCALADGVPDCWPKDGDYYVQPPEGVTFMDLHLGEDVICGVQTNGELMCWEYETEVCSDAGFYPCATSLIAATPSGTFSQVWANSYGACAVNTDGFIVCWPGDWGWGEGKAICTDDVEPPI